ncbi:hypothetical protein PITCH_A1380050 [uncultured Desulfobacterium sp.]|uniref:Uncharacterized protein n=1 Tax=uncultured Desulfobacterium sp. TaxID=201089 RepID=A0A445MSU7_9BACT|nr:hypothetical protein PITCH_A1380050 [uncultured Desulfobacterium sp.]
MSHKIRIASVLIVILLIIVTAIFLIKKQKVSSNKDNSGTVNDAASHICVGAPNMLWSDYCFSDRNELA